MSIKLNPVFTLEQQFELWLRMQKQDDWITCGHMVTNCIIHQFLTELGIENILVHQPALASCSSTNYCEITDDLIWNWPSRWSQFIKDYDNFSQIALTYEQCLQLWELTRE